MNGLFSDRLRLRRFIYALACLVFLLAGITTLSHRYGLVPPLGEALNPYRGLWWRPTPIFEGKDKKVDLKVKGLKARVLIEVDKDQIKHVFAENDHDLYFAQGYLLARERLWQMEFMSRMASGRLSEVFGEKTLEFDRYFRKLGVASAAEQSAQKMIDDTITGPAVRAYAEGVNAYILSLGERDLPFEYRVLGHRPEEWRPANTANLLKFMTWNLSAYSNDVTLTRSFQKLGRKGFAELFPSRLGSEEPIVPAGTAWPFPSRNPNPPKEIFEASAEKLALLPQPDPANGSNSWAVTSKKSSTGLPILSNDIHLNFSLPALWYEMQLTSPSQNVYGIALPGAPGIILGFNQKVAWGVTNGGTDVVDWYELRFRDEKRSEYLFDGGWRPVISEETVINVRDGAPRPVLLRETHFGPIVYDESETPITQKIARGLAMKWSGLEASNELRSFLLFNRSSSVADCRTALEGYVAPSQNFLCVDSRGDSGQWHMGRFPVRWVGQGRLVGDGSDAAYDWHGWIPPDEAPSVKQPARGFLSSANQWPADEAYPHYLGEQYEEPWRAIRINEILRSKAKFSPEDFVEMQMDSVSASARLIVPLLLQYVSMKDLNSDEQVAIAAVKTWDFSFKENSVASTIAHSWIDKFMISVWSSYLESPESHRFPRLQKTAEIMKAEPDSKWFDDPKTEKKETLADHVNKTLRATMLELREVTGRSDITRWHWGSVRTTKFEHIGKLPGLGDVGIVAGGSEDSIFANRSNHGPVWKVVVAVGPKPRAWSVYPGGQSGDPLSPHYDDFIEPWTQGSMKKVNFLTNAKEQNSQLRMEIQLEKEP